MKKVPIGHSDFKHIIDQNYYYIDKTLLIEEIIEHGGAVTLLPRPRRFGKTLNLSMIRYFFEKTEKSNAYLFEDKKIWKNSSVSSLQGTFPVIFLSLKSARAQTWNKTYTIIKNIIAAEFQRHSYLLESSYLQQNEITFLKQILDFSADEAHYKMSLLYLSQFLEKHHTKKVIILLDEYDSPIHDAFINGYYHQIIAFMRHFLTDGFKDNSHLERGVITGILQTAKEGIFSGLNNLSVFTILDNRFSTHFGFTQEEINNLLIDYNLTDKANEFKKWYNGYCIGNQTIYNPWSSLSCVDNNGICAPYWVNTSDNALIRTIISSSTTSVQEACSDLLAKKTVPNIHIEDRMTLPDMLKSSNCVWSLLLFSGYVTPIDIHRNSLGNTVCTLQLPNQELLSFFHTIIRSLFTHSLEENNIGYLQKALALKDGETLEKLIQHFILSTMSYHDIAENEPEKSYHLFVLGLFTLFSSIYTVQSNRESGYGRFDIMLIPYDKKLPGIIIEFKKKDPKETMEECAQRALQQIKDKKYSTQMINQGVTDSALFGIACYKKEIVLKQE